MTEVTTLSQFTTDPHIVTKTAFNEDDYEYIQVYPKNKWSQIIDRVCLERSMDQKHAILIVPGKVFTWLFREKKECE